MYIYSCKDASLSNAPPSFTIFSNARACAHHGFHSYPSEALLSSVMRAYSSRRR